MTSADIATTQQVATDRIAGKYKLLIHNYKLDHTRKAAAEPIEIEFKGDGTIAGGASGTWKIDDGSSYLTLKINNTYYHGVMVEQTLEPSDTKVPAFTVIAANTGTTAWGYQTEATTGATPGPSIRRGEEGYLYDINGYRVSAQPNCQLSTVNSQLKKGVYIRNGKKYIVK